MIEELRKERLRKLGAFQKLNLNPFPPATRRTHRISELIENFSKLSQKKEKRIVAGRIIGFRNQGNVFFIDLKDEGGKIQLVVRKDLASDFELFRDNLDIGDFLEGEGMLFATKRGEKSIEVKQLTLLAKSLRPLPSSWHGLTDRETRLRKRYLDLFMDPSLRELFAKKERFWSATRKFLKEGGFLEVETPVLEAIPGGADAEPFITRHNALNQDFYLRISLELPLKRLVVGGYEKVFEIGRIFRNEGIDAGHLQDYTALEFYWAYHDYRDLMPFVEKLFKTVVKATVGKTTTVWQGKTINWGRKWPRIDYREAFEKAATLNPVDASRERLLAKAKALGLSPETKLGKGRLIDMIYKRTVRPNFIQPAFLIHHPVAVSPLAKRSLKNPELTERIQVVACGTELGNGWSELNDPIDQRRRFEEQMALRKAGDKEAQMLDEDFIEALEYGMPPTAGFGFSERLFAVLFDRPVRETVIFPLMRPKKVNANF